MRKRVLAIICALSILFGVVVAPATAATASDDGRYKVGYAIKDINPWVDYNDHSKGIQTGLFNLTGNGDDAERPLEGLFDDNGDGVRGEGDGIFTTATAVTDQFGKTVIYITIDSLQGDSTVTKDARTKIVERLGSNVISADQIMVSASHTHSSAPFTSLKNGNDSQKAYYSHVINQITDAAAEAYADRAPADMSKGTVDAKEATAALGYNNGKGYHMNAIRHYEVTAYREILGIRYSSRRYLEESGDLIDSAEYRFNGREYAPVEESDNDMHLLLFKFPDNPDKKPVVFVNWRAHTTMNSTVEMKMLSSDYVNGLRTVLAAEGYRIAFFQGAAANVVTAARSAVWNNYATYKDWLQHVDDKVGSTNRDKKKTYIYGRLLAEIAQYCIEDSGNMQELPAGKIRNTQLIWHGELQPDSDGLRAAAAEAYKIEAAGGTINYPYAFKYEGKTYILNSSSHRNLINTRANASADYTDLELNVIILGDEVAFVTAPNELPDKLYTYSSGEKFSNLKNDWQNLVDPTAFGTPFVLGYTNGGMGYIANWLDHTVNSQTYTDITGFAKDGKEFFSPGTYEANTSRLAQGEGEELLTVYQRMIDTLNGEYDKIAECKHCGKDKVTWKPLFKENCRDTNWTGHYYLYEDLTDSATRTIQANDQLCLDLNGKKIEATSRTFSCADNAKNAVVSIMDSVGTGKVIGNYAGNNPGGGSLLITAGNTLNIYGGTFQFNNNTEKGSGTGLGGVMTVHGTLNMYGGTIEGAMVYDVSQQMESQSYSGRGGAVYLGGALNISGGSILSGSVPDGGKGPCVFLTSEYSMVNLSGNANVEDIYYLKSSGISLTISGTYTGSVGLTFDDTIEVADGMDIGTSKDAVLTDASITCTNDSKISVVVQGAHLLLSAIYEGAGAVVNGPAGVEAYDSLSDALEKYNGGLIKLLKEESAPVNITKDTYLDLAGFNVSGKVTVAPGTTLYVMDSQTDDYTVKDEVTGELTGYGKISSWDGSITGMPVDADCAEDGYLMIKDEQNNSLSFHRVNLQIHTMSLRSKVDEKPEPGVYYQSYFAGDELVADKVVKFGVALSISEMPDATNLESKCKYSYFEGFEGGAGKNDAKRTSTILKGIMKQTNAPIINYRNADMQIYGRAYVLLEGGIYMFGEGESMSLRQQVEEIDKILNDLKDTQKQPFLEMCECFHNVVQNWNVPNTLKAIETQ